MGDDPVPGQPGSPGYGDEGLGAWVWLVDYVIPASTVCYPAVPEVPSIPAIPATPDEIFYDLNQGWNSHSRSIEPLYVEEFIDLNCQTGITGALIGIDTKGKDFYHPSSAKHGIIVDVSGVKVFENGVIVQTIKNQQISTSDIRIYRQADNSVVYCIITDSETLIVESGAAITQWPITPLFVYARLWSGGDQVTESEMLTGEVQFGAA